MTLGFKTELGGKPTHFPEKILESLLRTDIKMTEWTHFIVSGTKYAEHVLGSQKPKHHTIRYGHRWREGMKIHFVTGNRTKHRHQFAPIVLVNGVQMIWISPSNKSVRVERHISPETQDWNTSFYWHTLNESKIAELAINDGFETVDHFWDYFNTESGGQIIHWTDLKY
jgi:hypothetical protein